MPSVFITGAARRIGKGLARRFAARGWDVAVNYRRREPEALAVCRALEESYGVRALPAQADVSDPAALQAAFAAVGALAPFAVLVNNAGVFPARKAVIELKAADLTGAIETNVFGALFAAQEFVRHAERPGRIVNLGSLGASEVWKGRGHYHASKAALRQLTNSMALELAPDFSVNSVAPGLIELADEPPDEPITISPTRFPMGRYGHVDDVFEAVWFFATASVYITGQELAVDGAYALARG